MGQGGHHQGRGQGGHLQGKGEGIIEVGDRAIIKVGGGARRSSSR